MADRAINHDKIEIAWNSVVDEVLGGKDGVAGVVIRNVHTAATTEIECQGYFSAIGHQPNTEAFAGQLETDEVGCLMADGVKLGIPREKAASATPPCSAPET